MRRALLVSLFLALGAGCVSKADHESLQARYDQQVQVNQDQARRIQDLEKQLDVWKTRAQARIDAYQEILKEFKPLIDKGILEVKVEDGNVKIGMAADVMFSSGSARLSDVGKANLAEVAKVLARHQNREFQVEGHTDNQPISTKEFASNWYLGAARAITVVDYLTSNGMSREQVSAASYADTHPVAPNATDQGRAFNRRIEIILVPDLSDMPGFDDLHKADEDGNKDRSRPPRRPRRGR